MLLCWLSFLANGTKHLTLRGNNIKQDAEPGLLWRAGFGAARLFCPLFCLIATAPAFAAAAPEKTFDLTISQGTSPAEQRLLRVNKGDAVRLRLTSDASGEIHVHGYRLETKITPGVPAELVFKAHATGRYRIEWHRADGTPKAGTHHGPPLATLEVRPK